MIEADAAYEWFLQGYELHRRGRRSSQAEAAYRHAIKGGYAEAWLNLGMLLAAQPGRADEEEAAYRAAMVCDDPATTAVAASRLGDLLENLRGDLAGAQLCFEVARDQGTGETRRQARVKLAMVLAFQGDKEAAERELRGYIDERYAEEDGSEFHERLATRLVARAERPRSMFRLIRPSRYRISKRARGMRVRMFGARA